MKPTDPGHSDLLIIFLKNPVVGSVKSRLSLAIGDYNACQIYIDLFQKLHQNIKDLNCDKAVWYSDFIDENDIWENNIFIKRTQMGENIGERMMNAFEKSFNKNYERVILVGSDIINLSEKIINTGFNLLVEKDIVLGPAYDGGYYLVGMKKFNPALFFGNKWSTESVLKSTLKTCKKQKLSYGILNHLSDLDTIDDFKYLEENDRLEYLKLIDENIISGIK